MRIVHISTTDISGGAAIAAYRLHQGLLGQGFNSRFLVHRKISKDKTVINLKTKSHKLFKYTSLIVDQLLARTMKTSNQILHSPAWYPTLSLKNQLFKEYDLIQLHWICGGFIRLEELSKLKKPVVWTLHDMWPFCGAEHYTDSLRYIKGYDSRNRPSYESGFDLNKWVWSRKLKTWKKIEKLTIVCPSNWLAECAKKSFLFHDRKVVVIPNGIDLNSFKPIEKKQARRILNLPQQSKIILIGAQNFKAEPRKGFDLIAKIIVYLAKLDKSQNFVLATFGSDDKNSVAENIFLDKKRIFNFGHLNNIERLRLLYSVADIFLVTSKQDNLPNTIMESMACATPCIAFDIGGIRDLIDSGINGFLIPPFKIKKYAKTLMQVLSNSNLQEKLSRNARKKIVNNFDIRLVAKKYIKLYGEALKN